MLSLLQTLTLSPATGDNTPTINIIVYIILGLAAVSALVLGFINNKKK